MIYAIQAKSGPVKIGKSGNVGERLVCLQTATHKELMLLASADVADDHEKLLHEHLKDCRLLGEWFSPTIKTLNVVELIKIQNTSENFVIKDFIYHNDKSALDWFRARLGLNVLEMRIKDVVSDFMENETFKSRWLCAN